MLYKEQKNNKRREKKAKKQQFSDNFKHETSCGAIVFRQIGLNTYVLLVQHGAGHWSFPKGHMESGETEHETAIREVKEETGIDIDISKDFVRLSTYSPYPGAIKTVKFFLGDYLGGTLKPQLDEVKRVAWLRPEESVDLLVFDRDLEIFHDALAEISYEFDENCPK